MKTDLNRSTFKKHRAISLAALVFIALFAVGDLAVSAQQEPTSALAPAEEAPKISNDELDSLVAPIALYPDPLLSQMLVASTYPLELIQLQQWLEKTGAFLNEKALAEAVQKEEWDPSIQAMAVLPTVVKQLATNIKWTSDLGNAFLAQQSDVMDAVQRMRTKAKDGGKLKSDEKIKVETQQVESKTYVVIEQASPEVVYVPDYNPALIWGAMYYPYPYMYYPPYGYYGGAYIGYGAGIALGIAWAGGWGWGAGWGNNDININRSNNFNRNTNINGGDRVNNIQGGNRNNIGSGNKWQHNPQHRGGAPYANRSVENRFGGARRDSTRQNPGNRPQAGNMDLSGLRGNGGSLGGNRPQAGNLDLGGLRGNGGSIGGNRGALGGERIGSRDISRGVGQRNTGSFGGSGSFGGGAARTSSSRGASSMGGYGGGGMRGGGMRGGGRRR